MRYIPWGLAVWEWLPALSLQSDLIKCKILQSHCHPLRTLHISSLCSQVFLLLQIKPKANMTLPLWQRWIAPSMHFLISLLVVKKTLSFKRAHPAGDISQPSLQPSRSLWLCCGQWNVSRSGCVSTDAPLTLLRDYLCTTFKSLIFHWWIFFSACTIIFLKLFLSASNLVFSWCYFVPL